MQLPAAASTPRGFSAGRPVIPGSAFARPSSRDMVCRVCVSSSHEDTSHVEASPTLMTPSSPDRICKDPIRRYSHAHRCREGSDQHTARGAKCDPHGHPATGCEHAPCVMASPSPSRGESARSPRPHLAPPRRHWQGPGLHLLGLWPHGARPGSDPRIGRSSEGSRDRPAISENADPTCGFAMQ